ncbi:MAG: sensor histidine kinase [Oscillospiraceae bacterium]|nr:sensor histidine kinase [Oscillospiraceae bacterium]
MKLSEFCRDRLPAYGIGLAAWLLTLIFLYAFRVSGEAMVIVSVVLLLGAVSAESWAFLRKKQYYDKLLHCLEGLDQKYLLPEIAEDPGFLDGHLLYGVLQETERSMCEHIAGYRRESREFREFIELWVHEVKLPVASLALMCHNDGDARYDEQLRRIDADIEKVLYYARSGEDARDYLFRSVSLKKALAQVAVQNRAQLQELHITLQTQALDTEVITDGKWLGFILGQLMANSMQYGASQITVTAQVLPDRTLLSFRDNGIGIAASDLPYLFEKSFTGQNGRTHARSTGMGLYLVKKLCDKLGHGVAVQSVQGAFTEVTLTFGRNDLHMVTKM